MAYSVNKFTYSVGKGGSTNWLLYVLSLIILGIVSFFIWRYFSDRKKDK